MEQDDKIMNELTPPPAAPSESTDGTSRRRFLKGTTLAMPAVMTLNSTAARAQAAASSTCAAFPPTGPIIPCTTAPDGFYREKVACHSKLTKTGSKWVAGTTPEYFKGLCAETGTYEWREFATGNRVTAFNMQYINEPQNANCVLRGAQICSGYALVHFDQGSGLPVASGDKVPPPGTLLVSAAGECLNSLWGRTV